MDTTTVHGKLCDHLKGTAKQYWIPSPNTSYFPNYLDLFVYSDNGYVLYSNGTSAFDTMAHVNAIPGESWSAEASYGVDRRTVVDTGRITIAGKQHRALFFDSIHTKAFVDGVGYNYRFFCPYVVYDDPNVHDEEIDYSFKCYSDNTIGTYPVGAACNLLETGLHDSKDVSFELYPNPVVSVLFVQSRVPGIFRIHDVLGTELKSFSMESGSAQLNCGDVKAGVYVGIFETDKGILVKRLLKE